MSHPSIARDNHLLSGFSTESARKVTACGSRFSLRFKRALWEASYRKCAYCGDDINHHKSMHVDHFNPIAKGGENDIANFICSCRSCNVSKNSVDMDVFRLRMSINKSKLKGILKPDQVLRLQEIGVVLPFEIQEFYFEILLGGKKCTAAAMK